MKAVTLQSQILYTNWKGESNRRKSLKWQNCANKYVQNRKKVDFKQNEKKYLLTKWKKGARIMNVNAYIHQKTKWKWKESKDGTFKQSKNR